MARYRMRIIFRVLFMLSIIAILSSRAYAESMEDRVVNIIVTAQKQDYGSPWQKGEITRSTVTGCVISDKRILTAAYSITDHVVIEVMKKGESRKYQAEVVIMDYHSGLAIIKPADETFFDGLKPATLSPAGKITGRVGKVFKWDSLGSFKEYIAELTKSSIRFYEPNCGVLMHQFSTSMNDGGNGEPVFVDGMLAGISTGLSNETKTLYVIGIDMVHRLLKDASDGTYEGMPFFWVDGADVQSDATLREYYHMGPTDSGILVTDVPAGSSGSEVIKVNDVILSVDGTPMDDNGMYESPYGKLYYYGLLQLNRFVGDTVSMRLLRSGKKIDVKFKLKPVPRDYCIIPLISYDTAPSYYIFGGIVFQNLSMGYLEAHGAEWKQKADKRLLYYYDNVKAISSAGGTNRVVILNRVLPDTVNQGYQFYKDLVLLRVNGTRVKDLAQMKTLIECSGERFVVFDFAGETTIVVDRKLAIEREQDLKKNYNINSTVNISGD
jgi:S1-C subfamily serine protease